MEVLQRVEGKVSQKKGCKSSKYNHSTTSYHAVCNDAASNSPKETEKKNIKISIEADFLLFPSHTNLHSSSTLQDVCIFKSYTQLGYIF